MKIAAVIVTYNRLEKLKKCLEAYELQTVSPCYMCVVDNHSTDGTEEFLRHWEKQKSNFEKVVIRCEENLGGAGGFATGIRRSLQSDADWIWISDDDAYPNSDCLERIKAFYESISEEEQSQIAAICSKVNGPGGVSTAHRRYFRKKLIRVKQVYCAEEEYEKGAFDIDCFSFVGSAVKKEVLEKIGLPREEYFIFYDDTEYALRTKKEGRIVCIPSAVVWHDSKEMEIAPRSWKYYYLFRNWLYTYKLYYPGIYFRIEELKLIVMICIYYCNVDTWIQFRDAVKDVKRDRLGKNRKYLP